MIGKHRKLMFPIKGLTGMIGKHERPCGACGAIGQQSCEIGLMRVLSKVRRH